MIRIVTDSTCDLPTSVARDLGVTVVPLKVIFGDEALRDGVDITTEQFYERLRTSKVTPKTSQPSIGAFKEAYEALAPESDAIISLHVASTFSGTYDSARQAAEMVQHGPPITVIDTRSVSLGLGMAVRAAAVTARHGGSAQDALDAARDVYEHLIIYFTMDTLEYLARGGRIGKASQFLGTLLNVKPVLEILDGEVKPTEKARTSRRAIERLIELVVQRPGVQQVAAIFANPEVGRTLADAMKQRLSLDIVLSSSLGPVVGAHGGPNTSGLAATTAARLPD